MAKPYIIGNQHFPTKVSAEVYIRAIIDRYPNDATLNAEDFAFVLELLKLHPKDKIKAGIATICAAPNPDFPKTRCFWLTYVDGTVDDVSWSKCLSPPTPERKFAYACRRAIDNQISRFRQESFDAKFDREIRCPISNEILDMGSCDVDHVPPETFARLTARFQDLHSVAINTVTYEENGHFADSTLKQSWADYHLANAQLRLTSRHANRSTLRKNPLPIDSIPHTSVGLTSPSW